MTTLYMLAAQSRVQMMSFIITSTDGHLVVIDGGNTCDADFLCTYVRKLGGHIDGWFITHCHSDHMNAFSSLFERHADKITLDRLYYNFPSREYIASVPENSEKSLELVDRFETQVREHNIPVTTPHRGDVFTFGEMKFTVLREPDESIQVNHLNNSSMVYRLDANDRSVIFLGDLGVEGGHQLLEITPPELMKAEFVQMAHHGQQGVDKSVYDAIDPDYCLWPTPDWLWDNNNGRGYDTHIWKTVVTRGWMSDIGVRWHYIMKDGTQEVPFDEYRNNPEKGYRFV
ncbi:MAG: MBL fold metallo-hydrolase [Clostridia bacterium]|nr:MBL fold metallo-hydrolase [Clostridia bacterium]